MIFDLPSLLGFIPLILYIACLLAGVDLVFSVFSAVIVAAIFTGQTPLTFSAAIVSGLGSFLGMIGFIVIMGAGLGKVLIKTNVAHTFVNFILEKIGIKTQRRAMLAIMIASGGLTCVMGTSNGVLAILAPIIIPVCAKLGFTRNAVGVLMHGSAAVGLFLGPFTPPTVTTLALSGATYGTYLINAALPVSACLWISTFFMVQHIQKKTADDPNNFYTDEEYDASHTFVPTPEGNRNTIVFFLVILVMVIYGIIIKSGPAFALLVMIFSGIAVAISARMRPKAYVNNVVEGSGTMLRMFFFFILCAVMLNLIGKTGAFKAMSELMAPIANAAGSFGFAMFATLTSIFGITGAAVAQEQIMATLFGPTVEMLQLPSYLWATIMLVGSQITSFVIPGGDLITAMSLARSVDVKSMLKNGYAICLLTVSYVAIRTLLV